MELVRGLGNLRPAQRGAVATIGAFDGVHLGHQALIRRTRQLAALHNRTTMLITFEPLPREYLQRDAAPARLTNFRERWRLLSAAGVDALLVLRFNAALQQMHGDEFVALLARELQLRAIVVGYDFRFGRGGEMTAGVLEELGRQHGFGVEIVPPVLVGNERCSSSRIRAALSAADFAAAAQLLGRPYSMRGRVVRGQQLGRSLGFPTANVRLKRRHCPLRGIFAARARGIAAQPLAAVSSLGTRPTIGAGGELLLETYIFDFDGDLYGCELEIEFVARLRDEVQFADLPSLVAQMRRDSALARRILAA